MKHRSYHIRVWICYKAGWCICVWGRFWPACCRKKFHLLSYWLLLNVNTLHWCWKFELMVWPEQKHHDTSWQQIGRTQKLQFYLKRLKTVHDCLTVILMTGLELSCLKVVLLPRQYKHKERVRHLVYEANVKKNSTQISTLCYKL